MIFKFETVLYAFGLSSSLGSQSVLCCGGSGSGTWQRWPGMPGMPGMPEIAEVAEVTEMVDAIKQCKHSPLLVLPQSSAVADSSTD